MSRSGDAVIAVFALAVTAGVAGVALATGAALFPLGPVTLLSGTTVPPAAGPSGRMAAWPADGQAPAGPVSMAAPRW